VYLDLLYPGVVVPQTVLSCLCQEGQLVVAPCMGIRALGQNACDIGCALLLLFLQLDIMSSNFLDGRGLVPGDESVCLVFEV